MKHFILPAFAAAGLLTAAYGDTETPDLYSQTENSLRAFNPAISVIVDTFYYTEDSEEGMSHVKEEMPGFGHAHHDDHGHSHEHGYENGFNLRHLELQFAAEVDNWFKATAVVAVSEESAEMEVAEIVTTGLPWGFQAKVGKFFSDFGYINARHSHEWDFTDQPLIYDLIFGSHGLNEKGAQLSWLAPTPFYLLFGAEALQGENEKMYNQIGGEELPSHSGPRLGVGWVKIAPNLPGNHACQLGLFGAGGNHQEAHDEDEDGTMDHWMDGTSQFWGGDVVYKYNSPRPYGQGDLTLQAEYMFREQDLTVEQHDLEPDAVGKDKFNEQDGLYAQATYGFLPRWRGGIRYEAVGLINTLETPEDESFDYRDSWRVGGMIDFSPSEFSRIRLQVNNGDYATEDGIQNVWEGYVQLVVSLGAHGAHKF